jgi:hypothetical protein
MNARSKVISMCLLLSVAAGSAIAQGVGAGQSHEHDQGAAQGTAQGHDRGMMRGGMMRGGMMGRGMMESMGGGMNCPMMGQTMQGRVADAGMSTLFGSRVVPRMKLSADDVREYLTEQIDRLGNKRLKVGKVDADTAAITAEVVTVDNSLVQRMKVDRSSGNIEYVN